MRLEDSTDMRSIDQGPIVRELAGTLSSGRMGRRVALSCLILALGAGCGHEGLPAPKTAERAPLEGIYALDSAREIEELAWDYTINALSPPPRGGRVDESMRALRDVLMSVPAVQDPLISLGEAGVYRFSRAVKMGLPSEFPGTRCREGTWSREGDAVQISEADHPFVAEPVLKGGAVVQLRVSVPGGYTYRRLPSELGLEPDWRVLQDSLEADAPAWAAAAAAIRWLVDRYLLDNARARFSSEDPAWSAPDSLRDTAMTLVRTRRSSLLLAVGCCLLGFCHGVGSDLDELADLVGDEKDLGAHIWAKIALELRFGDWFHDPLDGRELVTTEEVARRQVAEYRRRLAAAREGG